MGTGKVHKGQTQVVEGSAVGEFYVIHKMDYTNSCQLKYLGEAKIGLPDSVGAHFIQKFEYDARKNLERVLIATNESTLGCDEISVEKLSDTTVKVLLHSGDASEVTEGDSFRADTGSQLIQGNVKRKQDDQKLILELCEPSPSMVDEYNVSVSEEDVMVAFNNEKTKGYTKRRWDHRERYVYRTEPN